MLRTTAEAVVVPNEGGYVSLKCLADKKMATRKGDVYELLQDVELPEDGSSPSGAANFCAGTPRQGTEDWQDELGNRYPSEWWSE